MSDMTRRRAVLLYVPMISTFVLLRLSLQLNPDADFNVGGFNVHHLFTGSLITAVCSMWLAIRGSSGRSGEAMIIGLGIGLACMLDEVVYLIVTDGTNASYLTPVSWIGGIVLVGAAFIFALLLGGGLRQAPRDDDPR